MGLSYVEITVGNQPPGQYPEGVFPEFYVKYVTYV